MNKYVLINSFKILEAVVVQWYDPDLPVPDTGFDKRVECFMSFSHYIFLIPYMMLSHQVCYSTP